MGPNRYLALKLVVAIGLKPIGLQVSRRIQKFIAAFWVPDGNTRQALPAEGQRVAEENVTGEDTRQNIACS